MWSDTNTSEKCLTVSYKIDQHLHSWVCIQRNKSICLQKHIRMFRAYFFQKSPKLEIIQRSTSRWIISQLWLQLSNGNTEEEDTYSNVEESQKWYIERSQTQNRTCYMIHVRSHCSNTVCWKDDYFSIKLLLCLCPKNQLTKSVWVYLDSLFCSNGLSVYVFTNTSDDDYSSFDYSSFFFTVIIKTG